MKSTPLPEIYCKTCYCKQPFDPITRKPEHCIQCGTRFSAWHVASQLASKGQASASSSSQN